MDSRNTNSGLTLTGRIERKTHDVATLEDSVESWGTLSDKEKLEAARSVEPADSDVVYNVTTELLHQYFVDNLDPDNNSTEADVSVGWLALGTDSASGTDVTDTDLNSRTFEKPVTDVADNGAELLASTFIDSTEGNGNDFVELGLFTDDPANAGDPEVFLMNHATFSTVTKDNTKTVTFDVTLQFSDV